MLWGFTSLQSRKRASYNNALLHYESWILSDNSLDKDETLVCIQSETVIKNDNVTLKSSVKATGNTSGP